MILAQTIKGYGLGETGEGRNVTHQQKKLNEEELKEFRTRFGIPISDDDIAAMPFYRPDDDSPEIQYLQQRRAGARRHAAASASSRSSRSPARRSTSSRSTSRAAATARSPPR